MPAGMQLEADLESNSAFDEFDEDSESEPSPKCLANMTSRSTWTWKEHQISQGGAILGMYIRCLNVSKADGQCAAGTSSALSSGQGEWYGMKLTDEHGSF